MISCNHSINKIKIDQDTKDILNLAFDNSIGSDTVWRYHFKIPPVNPALFYNKKISRKENLRFLKWQDSLRSILDTSELFVVVNRKIDTLPTSEIIVIKEMLGSKNNFEYKMNGDTSFNETLKALCSNRINMDTIDTKNLATQFNYKIYSDKFYPTDDFKKIGLLQFSQVAFSNKRDKAAVYTSFYCGRLCGTGQILFYKKLNGKWKFIRKLDMWVS